MPFGVAANRVTATSASVLVEACVDSVESALGAERGGAGRLELCDNLADGGTTPSAGMIAAVKASVRIPVFVIVRARGGGFVYSNAEVDVMRRDVEAAVALGAEGVVIGALRPDARIDIPRIQALIAAAQGLPVTFHRAFDLVSDQHEALDLVAAAGISRVLTSGGASTAANGADTIASLVRAAGERLTVMAGGGIREENVAELVRRSGVREIHVRGTRLRHTHMAPPNARVRLRKMLPQDEGAWEETDEARVSMFVTLAAQAAS
jgi:copper homeostasis protein